MSAWNIQLTEVSGVLNSVAGHIGEEGGTEGLVGSMTAIEGRIMEIEAEADSTPVSVALSEFAQHHFGLMGDMVGLTISAIEGAGQASTAYYEGNLDMAAEAQANAGVVPEPEPAPRPHSGGPNVAV